jgi:hypothetical protein
MRYTLWLDDERDPEEKRWRQIRPIGGVVLWIKTVQEFKDTVIRLTKDDPEAIFCVCFDNDLGIKGLENEGRAASRWLSQYAIDSNLIIPYWVFQTANTVAKLAMQEDHKYYLTYRSILASVTSR